MSLGCVTHAVCNNRPPKETVLKQQNVFIICLCACLCVIVSNKILSGYVESGLTEKFYNLMKYQNILCRFLCTFVSI